MKALLLKSGVERPHLGWIHKLQAVPMRKSDDNFQAGPSGHAGVPLLTVFYLRGGSRPAFRATLRTVEGNDSRWFAIATAGVARYTGRAVDEMPSRVAWARTD